ncbi:Serine/threonine-protein kinase PknH [Nocardioides dokdonensis FR1436]|uniref:non-specific serine/threonine protein kinase n=1 Tax=Nocardioides dokdonensis FR1436 TaxID=1300347 RepID=A0A1A9GID8_9ACTN|nr:serine/threonine-protein kinase [Nocardioides dokdonensis]ANH37450.1 Serine/threonine-protein kinase PknH [Nocardioides dokdonensis FR1436]
MIRMPSVGEDFGRYHLLRQLGHGGMGVVYAARDAALDREVALKIITPQLAGDPEYRERFQREAMALSRMDSPHVVAVHDHGELDGCLYLVTQLVPDGDLLQRLRASGAPAPGAGIDLVTQVLGGLEDAHRAGIVHRDVKPSNVLLRRRGEHTEAFLCDFGIATLPGAEVTRTGGLVGSFPYMAPERHQGETAGVAGDVYATGCLLWHVLTGTAPYAGTDVEIAMAHLQAPVPQLPGTDSFVRGVNRVLARAMAKAPAERYASARAMRHDLARVRAEAPGAVTLPEHTSIRHSVLPGVPAATAAPRRPRRRRIATVVASSAAAVLLVGTGLYVGLVTERGAEVSATAGGPRPLGVPSSTPTSGDPTVPTSPAAEPGATLVPLLATGPRAVGDRPGGAPLAGSGAGSGTGAGSGAGAGPTVPSPAAPAPVGSSGGGAGGGQGGGKTGGGNGGGGGGKGNGGGSSQEPSQAEPAPDFRCWDGSEVSGGASACPEGPTGATGLRYMFVLDGECSQSGTAGGQVTALSCTRATPHGTAVVRLLEWRDVPTMKSEVRSYYGDRKPFGWTYGLAYSRPTPGQDLDYVRANLYGSKRFSVSVQGATKQARAWMLQQIRYRSPDDYRGYPI